MRDPTPKELQDAWERLQKIYKMHLHVHEVVLPKADRYTDKIKALWLAVLWFYENEEVHKDVVSRISQRDIEGAGADQQVRHLKRDGWDIGDKKGKHKLNPFQPSVESANERARKGSRLNAKSFDEVKRTFGGRCATCGSIEGEPDPRYGRELVKLEQGHMNPHKPIEGSSNIIPQCQYCNKAYKNDFVFDIKGRIRTIASKEPIRRAAKQVQKQIFEWLKDVFNIKYKNFVECAKGEDINKKDFDDLVACVEKAIIKYYDRVEERKYLMGNSKKEGVGVGPFVKFKHREHTAVIHIDSLVAPLIKAAVDNAELYEEEIESGTICLRLPEKYRREKASGEHFVDVYIHLE